MPEMAEEPRQTDLDAVASRLGRDAYVRRVALEEFRDAEFRKIVTVQGTFLKLHLLRPVQKAALWCLGLWGRGRRELLNPVVRENKVVLGDMLPPEFDGFRMLHLSDLHIDMDEAIANAVAKAAAPLEYDACVMTGDYRNRTIGEFETALSLMRRLRPALKGEVYGVLGNHDFADMVPGLEAAGYRMLLNEAAVLRRGGAALAIVGIDDPVIFETDDLGKALDGVPAESVKVLLSHSARVAPEAEAAGVALLLAGHTHGGQICFPGGRMILRNEGLPRRYLKGPWRMGNLHGYTSSGCGASGLPCRINCPAEIVLHTLSRG